jgi:large subunit ribosomal protein L28
MAKICEITGVGVTRGHHIHRSGKAKKEGGIGRHITKRVKRVILPNLRKKRIFIPELNKFVDVKLTARALKTLDKNGDGFITQDEVPAEAWERMKKADKNGDGKISAEELR